MVVGITFAGLPHAHILIAALVLIVVEASSMAFGAFLAEDSFLKAAGVKASLTEILFYALVMLLSYTAAGILVIIPYLLYLKQAYAYTLGIAILALFSLIFFVEQNIHRAIVLTTIGAAILGLTIYVGKALEQLRTPIKSHYN